MTTANQLAGYASSLPNFRNLLYNGAMQISQRGDVTGVTGSTYGGPDRFHHIMSPAGAAGTFSISQSSDTPDGFSKSMKIACTSSTSLGVGNFYLLSQKIEGQNVQHLEYGSSTAKSLTLSFWVKTNVAGDYAVEFQINNGAAHISKSFNISSAEASAFSWVRRTITIPGNTSTSITNDNTNKFIVSIWIIAGSDATSGTLNSSAWSSSVTQANRALPMNLGSSTSNEFYITGVQLEEGTVATPFEHRPYGLELSLCQRYYEVIPRIYVGFSNSTVNFTQVRHTMTYATQKRNNSPTVTYGTISSGFSVSSLLVSSSQLFFEIVHSGTGDFRPGITTNTTISAEL